MNRVEQRLRNCVEYNRNYGDGNYYYSGDTASGVVYDQYEGKLSYKDLVIAQLNSAETRLAIVDRIEWIHLRGRSSRVIISRLNCLGLDLYREKGKTYIRITPDRVFEIPDNEEFPYQRLRRLFNPQPPQMAAIRRIATPENLMRAVERNLEDR